ncbi:hypothetical protein SAMN04487969_101107 [Paenibacillus algorifonticola]|uniref:Uncharacterized protein n=1 Tax=Paenibacillus algorifonticola TaxID=684063 RepID=A0A1I1XUV8_9BACL|nr:hypothetical protein [Paenibacillus algorifonticola]SFE11082.1 hypothetical protein SAMN04487969_101107 [Paenibacillus algorifonticola]
MSKTVLFDVDKDMVSNLAGHIAQKNEDSLLVIAPFTGNVSIHAPAKKGKNKGYHRIKLEVWIEEGAIIGESALTDFGAFAVLRLPKARVQDHLINKLK